MSDLTPTKSLLARCLSGSVPSWIISLALHAAVLFILAMVTIEPIGQVINLLNFTASENDEPHPLDELHLDAPPSDDSVNELEATLASAETETSEAAEIALPSVEPSSMELSNLEVAPLDLASLSVSAIPQKVLDQRALAPLKSMLNSRSKDMREEMLRKFGGNAASEKSVASALKWLAAHQVAQGPRAGAWNFNHRLTAGRDSQSSGYGQYSQAINGATGLALLPFLGAGQTHLEGQYKETVKAGLAYLIANREISMKDGLAVGSWHEDQGRMYSHAIATVAVCEAYAMTRDPDLFQPAQMALNYLIYAQDPRGGGWRYYPQQAGDTSVVGWCLMALKSGTMGSLAVPLETFQRANFFLDLVSTEQGAFYGYDRPDRAIRQGTTAVGLLSRMYLGWPKTNPSLQSGLAYLVEQGPKYDDLYFSYYTSQIMRHHGGPQWREWNEKMRDALVSRQVKEGEDTGSWAPEGPHSEQGGRLCQTALATMILEVYYRHMPLYGDQSLDDDFEL